MNDPIDWNQVSDFLAECVACLPASTAPDICCYPDPDDKHKETLQYDEIADSYLHEIEAVIEGFVRTGKWPRAKGEVYFFVGQRLRFAHSLAGLFSAMEDTFLKVQDKSGYTRVEDLLRVLTLDVWPSMSGEVCRALFARCSEP